MKDRKFVVLLFLVLLIAISFSPWQQLLSSENDTFRDCVNGRAGEFPCRRVRLQSRVPLSTFSTRATSGSNLWGYVDLDDNREYAIIGLSNGTGVVDITDPVNPRVVGTVRGRPSPWREVKVYSLFNNQTGRWDAYAYISTEANDGGLQIINLSNLPNRISLVRTDREISTAHTLFVSNVDFATGAVLPGRRPFLYMEGTNRADFLLVAHEGAGRGLTVFGLNNPKNPNIVGNYSETYVHDVYIETIADARASQCAPGHNPCEVVFAWTGQDFRTIDFTEKDHPVVLGTLTYQNLGYAHSGWISKDSRSLFNFDETDELESGTNTRILTLNISDFRRPSVRAIWTGTTRAIEHNGYVVEDKLYVSHYTKGLSIFNVSTPSNLREIATFDTHPENDDTGFAGAWGVYPFLPSGNILISDMQRGLFVLKQK